METITIDKDITVCYVTATSFPEGVLAAHQQLHAKIPFSTGRRYFGISRPESADGTIVYRAAAEELQPGEGDQYGLDTLVLKSGRYISITIHNYMQDLQSIGNAFNKLLKEAIDPQGYCVELYLSDKDVRCMVRLKSRNTSE